MLELLMFSSMAMIFAENKIWKAVFGTVFLYTFCDIVYTVYVGALPTSILIIPAMGIAFALYISEVKRISDWF